MRKSDVSWLYLALAVFGFLHAVRDYLQMSQVWNWFTNFGHFWHAPQYEKYSLPISLIIGLVFGWLGIRSISL